jgi:hypothetical protein
MMLNERLKQEEQEKKRIKDKIIHGDSLTEEEQKFLFEKVENKAADLMEKQK